ncbi:hypothetical protein ACFM35_14375 [Microbacterium sp. P01]|uniref:hypothetical protein n=1 Tax=Microbacterium sp. P01 TaxID=3366261 RepID=UPI00366D365E
MMESRHLGPIALDGGLGGGAVEAVVGALGAQIDVRVEIDYPARFDESVVRDIDMVLDRLDFVDGLARQTIARGIRRDDTSAAQLFTAWRKATGDEDGLEDDFLEALRPARITITPDGGRVNRDRVIMTYALPDVDVEGRVSVRFVEPTGPELVSPTRVRTH